MPTSAARVARRHLAGQPGSLEEFVKSWLAEAGEQAAKMLRGTSQLKFDRGHLAEVIYEGTEGVESIRIRLNTYRNELQASHVGTDGSETVGDSMDFGQFIKYTPDGLAKWALASTVGADYIRRRV